MEHRNSVLIVEDDVNINGLLKEALEKEGYICTQAFSGTEARMILQGERYSVILLDLMLPGIPGEEVLRDIRKKGNTPVIIASYYKTGIFNIGAVVKTSEKSIQQRRNV